MTRPFQNRTVKCFLLALAILVAGITESAGRDGRVLAAPLLTDIAGHWAASHINQMVEQGILTGYPDGTFLPDNSISREEFAAVLTRATGLKPMAAGSPYFTDAGPGNWSYGNIQALTAARIIHPEDYNGRLLPGAPITRAEIATMLVRAAGFEQEADKKALLTSFSDPMPPWAKGYATVAMNHGLVTGYEDGTFRDQGEATRAEAGLMVLRMIDPRVRPATWVERYTYQGKTGTNTLKVVRVNFNREDIEIRPALSGTTKEVAYLADIAGEQGAVAAINGGFFSAYNNNNGDYLEPFDALAIDGQWVHFQYQGTALGITWDNRVIMDPIRMAISGSTNGGANTWTAWSVNHTSPDIIGLFTKHRGETTKMSDGVTYTVRNGRVVSKGGPDVPIPDDGYVIFVSSSRVNKWTDGMFPVGGTLSYKVTFTDHRDLPYPAGGDWQNIRHAIGCGPRLVTAGSVSVNPQAEGYTEVKQTTLSANRSGVGVTGDNIVMLVTCTSLTPQEFGEAMADLGSWDAMQMDSGASSCLWYDGGYLTSPGRMVSNGLCVVLSGTASSPDR